MGYVLDNHTWDHPNMTTLPASAQGTEMDQATAEQVSLTGVQPCGFRPPGGNYNSTTLSQAQQRRMTFWTWSVDTEDWKANGSSSSYWVNRIISLAEKGGSQAHPVVLMHNQPAGNPATVLALRTIIQYFGSHGYTFVDLLGRTAARTPGNLGDEVNPSGNGFDVFHRQQAVNAVIVGWTATKADPATHFIRLPGTVPGAYRFEYAPNGVATGLSVADPGYDAAGTGLKDGLVLRASNTGLWQQFIPQPNGTLKNAATGLYVNPNGTAAQLRGGTAPAPSTPGPTTPTCPGKPGREGNRNRGGTPPARGPSVMVLAAMCLEDVPRRTRHRILGHDVPDACVHGHRPLWSVVSTAAAPSNAARHAQRTGSTVDAHAGSRSPPRSLTSGLTWEPPPFSSWCSPKARTA
jgi:hypothetical protein